MSGKIYLISLNHVPKYVGFTTQTLDRRWQNHISDANTKSPCVLHQAIRKYGKEAFTIELIAEYLDKDFALNVCEEFWIRHLNTHVDADGYNMTYGGDKPPSFLGKKVKEETKIKIRNTLLGHTVSEETRKKISEKNTGKTRTEEVKQKMSQSAKGRIPPPLTDEWRKKQSESKKNKPWPEARRKAQDLKNAAKKSNNNESEN